MTNDAILDRVRHIVAEVSEVEVERITLKSSPANLEEWDSLAQVNIVLSLEQEFGHQFSPDQIDSMVSVEKILAVLTAHAA
jgi:acyl carrier protein